MAGHAVRRTAAGFPRATPQSFATLIRAAETESESAIFRGVGVGVDDFEREESESVSVLKSRSRLNIVDSAALPPRGVATDF